MLSEEQIKDLKEKSQGFKDYIETYEEKFKNELQEHLDTLLKIIEDLNSQVYTLNNVITDLSGKE